MSIAGIQQGDIAHASAMSLVLMAIILFFSLVQWVLTKERAPKDYTKAVTSKKSKEVEV